MVSSTARVTREFERSRVDLEAAVTSLGEAFQALRDKQLPVSPATVQSVQSTQNRWQQVEEEFGLLSSGEVAARQGSANRQLAYDQRRTGRLLGIRRGARWVYPGFQFDADGQPRMVVAEVARLGSSAGWTAADVLLWFTTPTTYLPDDKRPVDLLDSDPDLVVAGGKARFNERW